MGGGGGCFPKNKLRNTNYGLFGGSGKEMKFRRRLYRGVDKAKLGAGFFLEYSFISCKPKLPTSEKGNRLAMGVGGVRKSYPP